MHFKGDHGQPMLDEVDELDQTDQPATAKCVECATQGAFPHADNGRKCFACLRIGKQGQGAIPGTNCSRVLIPADIELRLTVAECLTASDVHIDASKPVSTVATIQPLASLSLHPALSSPQPRSPDACPHGSCPVVFVMSHGCSTRFAVSLKPFFTNLQVGQCRGAANAVA